MTRRWVWFTAGIAVLLAGTAVAVAYLRHSGEPFSGGRVVTPPGGPGGSVVRYDFDAGLVGGGTYDRDRRMPLEASEAAGGVLTIQPHGSGLAVRFPQVCPVYGDESCPRAILESRPAPALDPGATPFRFGAAVLVGAGETTTGGNVLQKGYSLGDSQFKLQIDGHAGKPTCVLVGMGDSTIYVVASSRTVADGQWHVVECSRNDRSLTIAIDGRITGRGNVPTELSIVNKEPLRIGGKGTSANNDQFHGAIDDAFVAIGA